MIPNMIDYLPKPKLQKLKEKGLRLTEEKERLEELRSRERTAALSTLADSAYGITPTVSPLFAGNKAAIEESGRRIKELKEELYKQQTDTYSHLPAEIDWRQLSAPMPGREERYRYINKLGEFEKPRLNLLEPK